MGTVTDRFRVTESALPGDYVYTLTSAQSGFDMPGYYLEANLRKVTIVSEASQPEPDPPMPEVVVRGEPQLAFAFQLGEIVQIDEADPEIDAELAALAGFYAIVCGRGIDAEGLFYLLGLRDEAGTFRDTQVEMEEELLLKVPLSKQQELRTRPAPATHLTLASSR